jgi:tRNA U34 5-methylaminomethyl-2-thiouridine-forming methyltransferase MnmC
MMANPPKHRWVDTEDGSRTLFSEAFQEACHSTSGAREETLLHYVEGCQIKNKSPLTILEVGFGLGIGFLTTFDSLSNEDKRWDFLSLELDEDLLEWFRLENVNHPFLKELKWINVGDVKTLQCSNEKINLIILCGDARKTLASFLATVPMKWNAIYQDAFSPQKNPTLWTTEWFAFLKSHSTADVILSTYSSNSPVRKSLLEAGWIIQKGKTFGAKRSCTRALLQGESDPDILVQLKNTSTPALRDDKI